MKNRIYLIVFVSILCFFVIGIVISCVVSNLKYKLIENTHDVVIDTFLPKLRVLYSDEIDEVYWTEGLKSFLRSKFHEGESFACVMKTLYEWDVWIDGAWNSGLWTVEPVIFDESDNIHLAFRAKQEVGYGSLASMQICSVFDREWKLVYITFGIGRIVDVDEAVHVWSTPSPLIIANPNGLPIIESHMENMNRAASLCDDK